MKTPDSINQVAEFHSTFKHPILSSPQIPDENRCKLRISLLQEELKELEEAIKNNDIVEAADAFADLQYVLSGAILEFGLGKKFENIFNEVQRSNMSKACSSEEEANATIKKYSDETALEYYSVQDGEKWLVYRKSDNKTIKSVNYSPANIASIVNG